MERLYSGKEPGALIREPTSVSCTAPSPVQLAVHPTWDQHGDIVGSGLAAAAKVGGTLELLATAGVKRGVDSPARALQYAARYCRP